MEPSNYNNLQELFEFNKSNSILNENYSNSLINLLNLDKEEKKIEKNNSLEKNSEKSTESNKDSEKIKNEGKIFSSSSKNIEKSENNSNKENVPNRKNKIKIKKKFSLGINSTLFGKKTKQFEIDNMKFLFGTNALKMFELLEITTIKKPKTKSGTFEVFMRKKHKKIFTKFPFFRNENWTINSDNSDIIYQENILNEEFNNPFINIDDNIFYGNNINNNNEEIINMENLANINVNQPGYNIISNEELNNSLGQLTMMIPNDNLSSELDFSVKETTSNTN